MNEINFEIQDIEKIDLSMDVGIKEIYPPIENLEVNPSKEQQVFNHENSYGYDKVTINPIPDEYIIPDGTLDVNANGDVDVTMFRMARVGVYTPPNLQDKELTINENGTHNIVADEEYDGLNQVAVTVNAIEDLSEELGTYNEELTEQETTITTIIETLQNKALKEIKLQDKEINITTNGTQIIEADNDYDGLGNVQVNVQVEGSNSSGSSVIINPITPACYSSDYNNVTSVTTNATLICPNAHNTPDSGDTSNVVLPGIVAFFVRSDYTISENLEFISETDITSTFDVPYQKLVICWCNDINKDFTISQVSSGRMGIGFVSFLGNKKPNIEVFKKENNYTVNTTKTLPIKSGITIYFVSGVYSSSVLAITYTDKNPSKYLSGQNNTHIIGEDRSQRLGIYVYYSDEERDEPLTGSSSDSSELSLIGITVK